MGQPLIVGREFTVKDTSGAPKVAVINETMAKYFFDKDNPVSHGAFRIRTVTRKLSARV